MDLSAIFQRLDMGIGKWLPLMPVKNKASQVELAQLVSTEGGVGNFVKNDDVRDEVFRCLNRDNVDMCLFLNHFYRDFIVQHSGHYALHSVEMHLHPCNDHWLPFSCIDVRILKAGDLAEGREPRVLREHVSASPGKMIRQLGKFMQNVSISSICVENSKRDPACNFLPGLLVSGHNVNIKEVALTIKKQKNPMESSQVLESVSLLRPEVLRLTVENLDAAEAGTFVLAFCGSEKMRSLRDGTLDFGEPPANLIQLTDVADAMLDFVFSKVKNRGFFQFLFFPHSSDQFIEKTIARFKSLRSASRLPRGVHLAMRGSQSLNAVWPNNHLHAHKDPCEKYRVYNFVSTYMTHSMNLMFTLNGDSVQCLDVYFKQEL